MSVGVTYTKPLDLISPLTVASAFGPIDGINDAQTSHLKGEDNVVAGVPQHTSAHIKQGVLSVASTLDNALTNPVHQDVLNSGIASAFYQFIGANGGTGWAGRVATFVSSTGGLTNVVALLANHTHLSTGQGGVLTQAATHASADTDGSAIALHHTLGAGAFQAAAGNHTHAGFEQTANKGAASGYAPLDGTTTVPVAYIPAAIARVSDLAGYVPNTAKGAASGVATLDGSSKLTASQIPATVALVASTSALGHVHGTGSEVTITTVGIADAAVVGGSGTGAKIAAHTVGLVNVSDGWATAQGTPDATVNLLGFSFYNTAGVRKTVSGLSPTFNGINGVPTAGNQRIDMLYADDTGALAWKAGTPVASSPVAPTKDANTYPLIYAGPILSTTTVITSGMISDARPSPTAGGGSGSAGGTGLALSDPIVSVGSVGDATQETDIFTLAAAGYAAGTTRGGIDLSTWRVDLGMMGYDATAGTLYDYLQVTVSGNIDAALSFIGGQARLAVPAGQPPITAIQGKKIQKCAYPSAITSNTVSVSRQYTLVIDTNGSGGAFTIQLVTAVLSGQIPIKNVYYDSGAAAMFYLPPHGPEDLVKPILNSANLQKLGGNTGFYANAALPQSSGLGTPVVAIGSTISRYLPCGGLKAFCTVSGRIQFAASGLGDTRLYVMYASGAPGSALGGQSGMAQWVNQPASSIVPMFGQVEILNLGPGPVNFSLGYYLAGTSTIALTDGIVNVEISRM